MRNDRLEGVVKMRGSKGFQVFCKDAPDNLKNLLLSPTQLKGARTGDSVILIHNGMNWVVDTGEES